MEDRDKILYIRNSKISNTISSYSDEILQSVTLQAYADLDTKLLLIDAARRYVPELEHGDNGEWAFEYMLKAMAIQHMSHKDFKPEWVVVGG